MNQPLDLPHRRESVATLRIWMGLLVLAALLLAYAVLAPRSRAKNRGAEFPGVGVELSTLQFESLTGGAAPIRKADLRGKVTVIDFWGPWCPVCLEDMPH